MPSINTQELTLAIDAVGIVIFNKNLGPNAEWGEFDAPFDAIQFFTMAQGPDPGSTNCIPPIGPAEKVTLIKDITTPDGYDVEVVHVKLMIVGDVDYHETTPRSTWESVLDLEATDGAIASDGNFYLGAKTANTFEFTTDQYLSDNSFNLNYSVRFVIKKDGRIHYCQIDPLIKTSSEH